MKIYTKYCDARLFAGFVALKPQVNSYGNGGTVSSPNHTFFLDKLEQAVNQYFVHILSLVTDKQSFLNHNEEGRRMTIEIFSKSISTKVWDRARTKLVTRGSAVRLASVSRHVTNCATRPSNIGLVV